MNKKATLADAKHAAELADKIKPLLAGEEPRIQGAVISELLAVWLASHRGPNAVDVRADLMAGHVYTAFELLAYYDAELESAAAANGGVA